MRTMNHTFENRNTYTENQHICSKRSAECFFSVRKTYENRFTATITQLTCLAKNFIDQTTICDADKNDPIALLFFFSFFPFLPYFCVMVTFCARYDFIYCDNIFKSKKNSSLLISHFSEIIFLTHKC